MKKQFIAAFTLALSTHAWAVDFSEADAKFALRDQSRQATLEARAAYLGLANQGAKNSDLVRAAEGYLRTYAFEGTHYTPVASAKAERKAIFRECWEKAAEMIDETNLGFKSPVYYYFRAACIAYEAEVSTVLERLTLLPKLNKTLADGLEIAGAKTYEGGGLLRVKAAVKGNPEAKGLPGGLYNPTEALNLINEALETEAYPDNLEGKLFCENYRRKIIVETELSKEGADSAKHKQSALNVAQTAITDFEAHLADGLLPEFIRAETIDCVATIKELKAGLEVRN